MKIFLLLVLSVISVLNQDISWDPVVQLPYGKVRGHVLKSSKNRPYYAFQDIPFAKPPIGNLRFKEAEPPEPWEDIKNTTKNEKKCVLFNGKFREDAPKENEDCLYTTVYTPKLPGNSSSQSLLPVFFVVFGGAFIGGNGDTNFISPKFFMDYDIIIVVPSYRVGPLGFLYEGNDFYDGNLGVKDVNYALKWTNENIEQFGGDPNKVTLGGISSGGATVAYLLMSEKSKGFYRSAIIQSGTTLCGWSIQKNPEIYPRKLATLINPDLPSNITSEEIFSMLKHATLDELKNASSKMFTKNLDNVWKPVIENKNSSNPFLTESTLPNLKNGNFNQVPTILGYTSEEYIAYSDDDWFYSTLKEESEKMDNDSKYLVNEDFDLPEEILRLAGAEMKKVYTNKTFVEDPAAYIKFNSGRHFKNPVIRHAELQSKYTVVYLYQFSQKGPLGNRNISIPVPGINTVAHSDDETYMYGRRILNNRIYPPSDKLTRERILKMWTNFIINLDPTPLEKPLLQDIRWPKFDTNNPLYLNFNRTLSISSNFEEYKKWNFIMEKYGQM